MLTFSRIGRIGWNGAPSALEDLLEEGNIGRTVNQEHDALKRNRRDQLFDLEDTSPVLGHEAAQIHQYSICFTGKTGDGHLPGIVMTEKVLNAEKSIGIRDGGVLR